MIFTVEDIEQAVDEATALCQERAGLPLAAKLAPFGIDPETLTEVLNDRWEAYRAEHSDLPEAEAKRLFARAYAEGMLVGRRLGR